MRRMKTLGIAVVAVLAMSAMLASTAFASGGTATVSAGTTSYTATQTGSGHTFTLPGGRVLSCSNATFSGSITDGASTVVAAPAYSNCKVTVQEVNILPATVHMNGCTYDFTLAEKTLGPERWHAETNVVCPAGKDIQITVFENAEKHTAGTTLCEYTIVGQKVSGVEFRNVAGGKIGILANNVGVAYTRPKGTIGNCGGASGTAFYNGDTEATAVSGSLGIH